MAFANLKTLVIATALAASGSAAIAGDLSDAEIIGIYSQVNSFDIETALLGELMGQSQEVRELGEMVSADHSGVRAAVHKMALDLNIKPVLPPSRIKAAIDHDQVVAALRDTAPEGFDAAYLKHEIAFHRAAISAVEEVLLPGTEAPELKAHFQAILPAFEHHLHANIEAAKQLGIDVAD